MSFEHLLTASFRDVTFLLEDVEGSAGRRAAAHEYPKKETSFAEDNGAAINKQSINARVVGDDYLTELSALLGVLNQSGPGELVHPWWDIQQVQIGSVTHKFALNTENTATVSFECFEAGSSLFPSQVADTAKVVDDKAKLASEKNAADFKAKFNVAAATPSVGDMVDSLLDDLDEFTRSLPSLPSGLGEWKDRLARVKSSVGKLLAYPGELAREIMGLVESVKSIATDPIRALDVYDQVIDRWNGLKAELMVTGGLRHKLISDNDNSASVLLYQNGSLQTQVLANASAFKALLLNNAAIAKASAIAASSLTAGQQDERQTGLIGVNNSKVLTGEQLTQMGNALSLLLGERARIAIDEHGSTESSALRKTLRDLRNAVMDDVNRRAVQLPNTTLFTPRVTMPVALIAYQQTGSCEQRHRIITRNGLVNPAFVEANTEVEIIHE
ncbi:DNA circulation protein-Mu-like prophage FluMu DNA circulation protein [Moritella viscosa]|uniref:DNA circularization protein n=1 Tax=Moritella viscosa TaxID=80854 RepID=UPI0009209962|nr:DNA circularization N-terminal domain-containing protein [Moritella viscosa]SHN99394.1 DNA circulation protein-Mu-like prophage FluMu DNA circulation protein [Moritella viscosa]SHO20100.1 DNA circulation protein-Mu-like prophage FluMu DNA circulation protein [Moritella viscosa]